MNMRLLPVAAITAVITVAMASSATAGGGGWPPVPGTYRTTDLAANANLEGPTSMICGVKGCFPQPSVSVYVNVDRGLHTFKPTGGKKLVQQDGTMLSFSLWDAVSGQSVGGCWIIDNSAFTVAKDLSTASLSVTVPADSNCPGTPMSVSPGNVVTPKGGGGGGGTTPTTLNVTWNYRGIVGHGRDQGSFQCGAYETRSGYAFDHATADAAGQVTGAAGILTSSYASIDRSSTDQVVKGLPVDTCY